jgi:hypothetical protein
MRKFVAVTSVDPRVRLVPLKSLPPSIDKNTYVLLSRGPPFLWAFFRTLTIDGPPSSRELFVMQNSIPPQNPPPASLNYNEEPPEEDQPRPADLFVPHFIQKQTNHRAL